jgi:hypothetical protein
MGRSFRIISTLAVFVCSLTLLLTNTTASGEPGTSPSGIIKAQRIVIPAPDDDDVSPRVERSVEAPSSQGKALPVKAEMAVADVRSKDCGDGSGAESRLGLMQRMSIHGHCGTR